MKKILAAIALAISVTAVSAQTTEQNLNSMGVQCAPQAEAEKSFLAAGFAPLMLGHPPKNPESTFIIWMNKDGENGILTGIIEGGKLCIMSPMIDVEFNKGVVRELFKKYFGPTA